MTKYGKSWRGFTPQPFAKAKHPLTLFYTRARAQKAVKVNFIPNQQHATTIPLALSIMLPLVFYPYTQLK
jgi:hypothetical protein